MAPARTTAVERRLLRSGVRIFSFANEPFPDDGAIEEAHDAAGVLRKSRIMSHQADCRAAAVELS
jgi:hypothetical protein